MEAELSVFDVLLQLLLHLAQAPAAALGDEETAKKVHTALQQRLRELLWRDLEQGCTWAHLSSEQDRLRTASDDSHWRVRRAHVCTLVASLGEPLRQHAALVASSVLPYHARMCDLLVPLLQGVLRTYRHFLAIELSAAVEARRAAATATASSASASACSSSVASGAAASAGEPMGEAMNEAISGFGAITIMIGQLSGTATPLWMTAAAQPSAFVGVSLPQCVPPPATPPCLHTTSRSPPTRNAYL